MIRRIRLGALGPAVALACALALSPGAARGEEDSTVAYSVGGISAGLCTLVYTPIKIVYAAGGLVAAPLVYLYSAGNGEATVRVARTSLRGDYVVTPGHLKNDRPLRFFGDEG